MQCLVVDTARTQLLGHFLLSTPGQESCESCMTMGLLFAERDILPPSISASNIPLKAGIAFLCICKSRDQPACRSQRMISSTCIPIYVKAALWHKMTYVITPCVLMYLVPPSSHVGSKHDPVRPKFTIWRGDQAPDLVFLIRSVHARGCILQDEQTCPIGSTRQMAFL